MRLLLMPSLAILILGCQMSSNPHAAQTDAGTDAGVMLGGLTRLAAGNRIAAFYTDTRSTAAAWIDMDQRCWVHLPDGGQLEDKGLFCKAIGPTLDSVARKRINTE